MSNYEDQYGYNRTSMGQFENWGAAGGANTGEQALAGVGMYDSAWSAQLKVEQARRINGQDPLTGVYLPKETSTNPYLSGRYGGSGLGSSGSGAAARDESQIFAVLCGVFKAVVLWPIAVALSIVSIGLIAVFVGRAVDGPSLAAKAAREEFANYQPAPLAARFTPKDLAAPIDPAALAKGLRAHKPDAKADPKQLRAAALMAQSYRCMFQDGCRLGLAKFEPEAAARLPYVAAGFLAPLAAKGDASAARDMCLFTIKMGVGYQDAHMAMLNCTHAVIASKQSAAAKETLERLSNSWAMKKAQAYIFADELQKLTGL